MAMAATTTLAASAAAAMSLPPPPPPRFLLSPQHLSFLTSRPPPRLSSSPSPPLPAHSQFMNASSSSTGDSVAGEDASLPKEPHTPKPRKPSPLERGGTLVGQQAQGKDPAAALGQSVPQFSSFLGKFEDSRWKNGTWDLQQFTKNGKVDWDAVIDAEVFRRTWLEQNPEASSNDEPVVFETSVIPWWAWVKRFHLPEAEILNGRAAMVGFFMAYLVDSLTGAGLVDQTSSFLGKLLLFVAVVGVLLIRKKEDVAKLRRLVQEWNFYDKQWQATWQEGQPQSGSEKQE